MDRQSRANLRSPRASADEWLRVRQILGAMYAPLSRTAAQLYDASNRVGDTGLIAPKGWLFPQPIDLREIRLTLNSPTLEPTITGTEDESRAFLPLLPTGDRYSRYSEAIRDIAKPSLFENRSAWRLLDVAFSDGSKPSLTYGDSNYFEAIDVCEAVAHETAAKHVGTTGEVGTPSSHGLRFRSPNW
jgi:hypothetical protein